MGSTAMDARSLAMVADSLHIRRAGRLRLRAQFPGCAILARGHVTDITMSIQVALLRGINVGSHNRIAMAELRELLVSLGYSDARTLVQSGNIVLTAAVSSEQLARKLELEIAGRFGVESPVIVRTREELAAVVALDPLGNVADQHKLYQVSFLSSEPDPRRWRRSRRSMSHRSASSMPGARSTLGILTVSTALDSRGCLPTNAWESLPPRGTGRPPRSCSKWQTSSKGERSSTAGISTAVASDRRHHLRQHAHRLLLSSLITRLADLRKSAR